MKIINRRRRRDVNCRLYHFINLSFARFLQLHDELVGGTLGCVLKVVFGAFVVVIFFDDSDIFGVLSSRSQRSYRAKGRIMSFIGDNDDNNSLFMSGMLES